MCSARIRDGLPERLLRRRLTAHSISPFSGTTSLTMKGFIATGMLSPGGGTWLYSATLSARDPLELNSSGRRSAVERSLLPPLDPVPGLLDEGWIRPHQRLHLCPRLVRSPSPIRRQTRLNYSP